MLNRNLERTDEKVVNYPLEILSPMHYKREVTHRIFVNRNIYFDRINFFGFDMDYTLAEYISPDYEELIYRYAVNKLIDRGYPKELANIPYDGKFAIRGLVFDKQYGNFLKVDPYGNILTATHGLGYLELNTSRILYKNRFVDIDDNKRFVFHNTLFDLADIYLVSLVINYFNSHADFTRCLDHTGVKHSNMSLTYKTIYDDIKKVINEIHQFGPMKNETIKDITKYIKKDERLPILIQRMRNAGKKVFIVTNSDFCYTNSVLSYLFEGSSKLGAEYSNDWKSYFDLVVVDATKPLFFEDGTCLCQVDAATGKKSIGKFEGISKTGDIFAGGNSEILSTMLGAQGKDILYVGDHIFGDILKSKKKQGWKTYLVIPELLHELKVWVDEHRTYQKVKEEEAALSNLYKNLDSETCIIPTQVNIYRDLIRDNVLSIEKAYGTLGSLLRSGTKHTFFASQLMRFADLYSHTCLNLLYYPFCYLFRAPTSLMPHEATVSVTDRDVEEVRKSQKAVSTMKANQNLTICAEEQELDEISPSFQL